MRVARIFALVAAAVLIATLPAMAQGRGKGHGKGKGNPHAAARSEQHAAARYEMSDDGWERHDNYDLRIFRPDEGVPPGWSKGNKTGWRDCGLPPGQAKKYGCRSYVYSGRRYYYYRDDIGRIILRRPRIEIHAVIR